jgi:hypothetical protein
MFCPVCRDEFRPGFTRCAGCDVDLVASLGPAGPTIEPETFVSESLPDEPLKNFCGFLSLDEARAARDKVRETGRRAEILITEPPGARIDAPVQEEYWLRVMPRDAKDVAALVGYDPGVAAEGPAVDDDSFTCSACGATVGPEDEACPGCGLGFAE